jgi:hypothetical protein
MIKVSFVRAFLHSIYSIYAPLLSYTIFIHFIYFYGRKEGLRECEKTFLFSHHLLPFSFFYGWMDGVKGVKELKVTCNGFDET